MLPNRANFRSVLQLQIHQGYFQLAGRIGHTFRDPGRSPPINLAIQIAEKNNLFQSLLEFLTITREQQNRQI